MCVDQTPSHGRREFITKLRFRRGQIQKRAISLRQKEATPYVLGAIDVSHSMSNLRQRRMLALVFAVFPTYVNPALIPFASCAAMRCPVWTDVLKRDDFIPVQEKSTMASPSEIHDVLENQSDFRWQPSSRLTAHGVGCAKSAISRARTAVDALSTSFMGPAWCAPWTRPSPLSSRSSRFVPFPPRWRHAF